jgi:transaldolase
MGLFLDSASVEEARQASGLGLIEGITTNPILLAQVEGRPEDIIINLCNAFHGLVFYQLTAPTVEERHNEARHMASLRAGQIGLKIPCTLENLALANRLVQNKYIVGITAIFSPAQVYLACQAGVKYILPYVNRSTRLLGDGIELVSQMRAVIDACGSSVEVLAASVKTAQEAVATTLAGADHITLPLQVIQAMGDHELSEQAITEFASVK